MLKNNQSWWRVLRPRRTSNVCYILLSHTYTYIVSDFLTFHSFKHFSFFLSDQHTQANTKEWWWRRWRRSLLIIRCLVVRASFPSLWKFCFVSRYEYKYEYAKCIGNQNVFGWGCAISRHLVERRCEQIQQELWVFLLTAGELGLYMLVRFVA